MRWSDVHERRKGIRNISWPQYQDSGAPVGLGDHVTASEFIFDSRGETEAVELYGRTYRITCVLHGWGIKEGYCVFGFEEVTDGE